ncbi:MAG: hypothetical protein HYU64_03235 [Armatimonadetes bacterium]|nr:hypothetical protein [Armatimonadota bacterium]
MGITQNTGYLNQDRKLILYGPDGRPLFRNEASPQPVPEKPSAGQQAPKPPAEEQGPKPSTPPQNPADMMAAYQEMMVRQQIEQQIMQMRAQMYQSQLRHQQTCMEKILKCKQQLVQKDLEHLYTYNQPQSGGTQAHH